MSKGKQNSRPLPPHFREGVRFECQGTGRCCTSPGQKGYVYLNLADRRRLARHMGLKTLAFTRKYCEREGERFVLKDCFERCRFLEGKSCGVYTARPLQCRIYPFWPAHLSAKTWASEVVAQCPGVGKGRLFEPEEIQALIALTDKD